MINKIWLFTFLFLLVSLNSISQELAIEDLISRFIDEMGSESNSEALLDGIQYLDDNPININTENTEDYDRLFFVDDKEIEAIVAHRKRYGDFITIYELAYVDDLSEETLKLILPFIVVSPPEANIKPLSKSLLDADKKLLSRFSRKFAYSAAQENEKEENSYFGSSDHIFSKISIHDPSRLKIGLSFEKDAGEKICWSHSMKQYGFDHYSFHAMLKGHGIIKNVFVGDYKLLFGQGLIQGSGFSLGKGMDPVAGVRKKGQSVRPHTGSAEFGYLRGVALELDLNPFKVITYTSYTKQDASAPNMEGGRDFTYVYSINETGLHRTESELYRKNLLPWGIIGFNAEYRSKGYDFLIGTTAQISYFRYPLNPVKRVYNQFDFTGRNNVLGGIHFHYRYKDLLFYGEGALTGKKASAFIVGIIGNVSDYLETTLLIRDYGRNYHAFHAYGFGESNRTRNEYGVYWGARIRPSAKFELNIYYDHFKFPWLRFRAYAPSNGYDSQIKIQYRLSRNSSLYFQYRQKEKEQNIITIDQVYGLTGNQKRSFRVNWSYKPTEGLRINSRIQWSNSTWMGVTTNGMTLVYDVAWYGKQYKVISRLALFDTDDYENRQYMYENDVLHYYSIPAYSGKGVRNYLVIQYKALRNLKTWLKIARTFQNEELEEKLLIPSYSKWEVRTQIQLTF